MSAQLFELEIIGPCETLFKGKATSLHAETSIGKIGILAQHTPLSAILLPGKITYTSADGKKNELALDGGLLKVNDNQVAVVYY
jgi:F-type H+-transporting ATPase subunit epsilon